MAKHSKNKEQKIKQLDFFSVLIVILVIILIGLLIIIHFKNKSENNNLSSLNISNNNK